MPIVDEQKLAGATAATRLKGNSRFNLYALALVSTTRLQAADDSFLKERPLIKSDMKEMSFPAWDDFPVSGTVLPMEPVLPVSLDADLLQDYNDAMLDEDVVVNPIYVNEFKIRVGSFEIDRSLPKISID